jgi:hypothetical protein
VKAFAYQGNEGVVVCCEAVASGLLLDALAAAGFPAERPDGPRLFSGGIPVDLLRVVPGAALEEVQQFVRTRCGGSFAAREAPAT